MVGLVESFEGDSMKVIDLRVYCTITILVIASEYCHLIKTIGSHLSCLWIMVIFKGNDPSPSRLI